MTASPFISFIAGILSFVSPCVLPIIPGYLAYISGISISDVAEDKGVLKGVILNSISFVSGFSIVFISLGAIATPVGKILRANISLFSTIAGLIIIFFSIHLIGFIRIPFLMHEKRVNTSFKRGSIIGSAVAGFAFGFGWTPCIGPILASILALAAVEETVARGVFLLSLYSLGMGIPFILTSIFFNSSMYIFKGIKRHLRKVEIISGILLLLIGIILLTGNMSVLSRYFPMLESERLIDNSLKGQRNFSDKYNFRIELLNKEEFELEKDARSIVVVNFWAPWCEICRDEISIFNELQREYGKDIIIVGIAVDSRRDEVEDFVKIYKPEFLIAVDNIQLADRYEVLGIPETFIFSGNFRAATPK